MTSRVASAAAFALLVALSARAFGAVGPPGAAGRPPGPPPPPPRPAAPPAPVYRPAAPPAPVYRSAAPPPGGFNFNHDVGPHPAPVEPHAIVPAQRPAAPSYRQPPFTPGTSGGPYARRFTGPIVRNAHVPDTPWGWNHNVPWHPSPVYWGGGFWGPFALVALGAAIPFGAIIDDQAQLLYPSYEVEPDTPGEQLLQDYGLTQTACGPPDQVVIWGPDNSVICAFPNDTVPAGNYQIDPTTFTLVPAGS